jgi:hypothetical protein
VGLLTWLLTSAACWGPPVPGSPGRPLVISLAREPATFQWIVQITGWNKTELSALRAANLSADDWAPIARVTVAGGMDVPIAMRHRVTDTTVELVPRFPLDTGREYAVTVDPTRGPAPRRDGVVWTRVTVPPVVPTGTFVSAIFPSAALWPENTLRFYLHFSSSMSGTSAVGHVRLVDASGAEVRDALLDVDVDLWNRDYTRRTVFFDPGRVKHGLRPNLELGRALIAGHAYAIVVSQAWRDATGHQLTREFRHAFTAGPALEDPVLPANWKVEAPRAGTREPLVVRFPHALDEGLLQRALGVQDASGTTLDGMITVGEGESVWTFNPAAPWRAAGYNLVVLTVLEDPAGNKVGQAFEFNRSGQPQPAETDRVTLSFRPRS